MIIGTWATSRATNWITNWFTMSWTSFRIIKKTLIFVYEFIRHEASSPPNTGVIFPLYGMFIRPFEKVDWTSTGITDVKRDNKPVSSLYRIRRCF